MITRDLGGHQIIINLVFASAELHPRLVACKAAEDIYTDLDYLPICILIDIETLIQELQK